jgi:hypothetical protein
MRFRKCLAELRPGAVFRKGREVYWYWTNCGHIEEGLEAADAPEAPQGGSSSLPDPFQFTSSAEGP